MTAISLRQNTKIQADNFSAKTFRISPRSSPHPPKIWSSGYHFYAYAFRRSLHLGVFPIGDRPPSSRDRRNFCIGFFVRPLGGSLFGSVADRHSKKNSMII